MKNIKHILITFFVIAFLLLPMGFDYAKKSKPPTSDFTQLKTAGGTIAGNGLQLTHSHKLTLSKSDSIGYDQEADRPDTLNQFKDNGVDLILKSKDTGLAIKISQQKINIGNQVCVIGNSFGLGQSLSCGIISAKNRNNLGFNQIENFIQTDAAVNPGASGAPLVNKNGELIGMVDAIYTKEADIDAGVNFAIDKKIINQFLNENYDRLMKN